MRRPEDHTRGENALMQGAISGVLGFGTGAAAPSYVDLIEKHLAQAPNSKALDSYKRAKEEQVISSALKKAQEKLGSSYSKIDENVFKINPAKQLGSLETFMIKNPKLMRSLKIGGIAGLGLGALGAIGGYAGPHKED